MLAVLWKSGEDDSINTERTYTMCSQSYRGGLPLTIINPNVHIKCQEPGTCVLEGGANQLVNLDTAVVAASPRDGYDSSNLFVEGMVFRGASDTPVSLGGPGLNMTLKDCTWTSHDTTNPPRSGVNLFRNFGENITDDGGIYNSLGIQNGTFDDNVFRYAAIEVGDDNSPGSPSHQLIVEDTIFTNNIIQNEACDACDNDTLAEYYSAVMSLEFAIVTMTKVKIQDNIIAQARAAIVVVNSDFVFEESSMTVSGNAIGEALGGECKDVAMVSLDDDGPNEVCTEFQDITTAAPVVVASANPGPTTDPTSAPSEPNPSSDESSANSWSVGMVGMMSMLFCFF